MSQSTATAYIRIRVTRIRVRRGLTVLSKRKLPQENLCILRRFINHHISPCSHWIGGCVRPEICVNIVRREMSGPSHRVSQNLWNIPHLSLAETHTRNLELKHF
jgi:hypothetical protein